MVPSLLRRSWIVLGSLLLLAIAAIFFRPEKGKFDGVPFVPKSEAEVLEKLASGAKDAREREIDTMRAALATDPKNVPLATALAKRDIEMARARMDPRYLGRAQAALAPWWDEANAPPTVLVLRATIRQSLHDFDGALRDLDAALRADPNDAQSWITRATVLTVRGDYDGAKQSCAQVARLAPPLVAVVCTGAIASLSGNAKGAYANLASLVNSPRVSVDERAWAMSSLGEFAVRAGDDANAEKSYKAALAIDPSDGYTLAAYADLLLDEGRNAEVVTLLAGRENDDNSLLRVAIAEKRLGVRGDHAALLRARYAASRERGDVVHRREQARFALEIEGDARDALDLARANWEVQKEPLDARVFLEAAIAAKDEAAARPVVDFLDAHHAEEPRLMTRANAVRARLK